MIFARIFKTMLRRKAQSTLPKCPATQSYRKQLKATTAQLAQELNKPIPKFAQD